MHPFNRYKPLQEQCYCCRKYSVTVGCIGWCSVQFRKRGKENTLISLSKVVLKMFSCQICLNDSIHGYCYSNGTTIESSQLRMSIQSKSQRLYRNHSRNTSNILHSKMKLQEWRTWEFRKIGFSDHKYFVN